LVDVDVVDVIAGVREAGGNGCADGAGADDGDAHEWWMVVGVNNGFRTNILNIL
jgi:hypothetical protein